MKSQILPHPHRHTAREASAPVNWVWRLGIFMLFLLCEAAIFLFGSYYFEIFPTNKNLAYNLLVSLWFKSDKRWNKYWQIVALTSE